MFRCLTLLLLEGVVVTWGDHINKLALIVLNGSSHTQTLLTSGILQPGVVLRTLGAGVQADRFAGQLSGGEGAGVGEVALRLTLHLALLLPRGKVTDVVQLCRLLHPLWAGVDGWVGGNRNKI